MWKGEGPMAREAAGVGKPPHLDVGGPRAAARRKPLALVGETLLSPGPTLVEWPAPGQRWALVRVRRALTSERGRARQRMAPRPRARKRVAREARSRDIRWRA